jgi:adenosine deaminase
MRFALPVVMMSSDDFDLTVEGVDVTTLPKVSLHDHLDGSLRPATILELAEAEGIEVPALTEHELTEWFARSSNAGSLVEYLTTFDLTCAVMQTAEGLARVARESVLDLAADGVLYAELRWAPEQHLTRGLSLDEVVEHVETGLRQGVEDAAALGRDIDARQIITAMRHADRSVEIAELAVRQRARGVEVGGVVGFDIAGAEGGFPASNHRPAFDLLARELFPTTVHAGEADGLDSIRSALYDGRAIRLGHGVRLAEDITFQGENDAATLVSLGELAQWVKDRGIALELSPSSNLQTGATAAWGSTMEDHPFDLFFQLGFAVTVNTDNRLQSGTTLSRELTLLADAFGYGVADLEAFQLNAAIAAFLPLDEREALAERVHAGFLEAVHASRRVGG